MILANINRNILLNDIQVYAKNLNKGGSLIMSGFYEKDLNTIKSKAEEYSFKLGNKEALCFVYHRRGSIERTAGNHQKALAGTPCSSHYRGSLIFALVMSDTVITPFSTRFNNIL